MRILLVLALLFAAAVPVRANQVDYFCIFSNAAAAEADGPVGAYWNATDGVWDTSRTFPGIKVVTAAALVNGINPNTAFWIIVSNAGQKAALDADTNCVMTLDRDIAIHGGSFVLAATLTGTNRSNASFSPVPHGSRYPIPLGQ